MEVLGDHIALIAIGVALFLGGVLKGAVGMGSPVIAVPVMASFVDVRLAVVVMVLPNLITNLWQLRSHLSAKLEGWFSWIFAIAGGLGVAIGSFILAVVSPVGLKMMVATAVMCYVALRLLKPDFIMQMARAFKLALPIGLAAGILQGAAGISAPISVSFLNALRLPREAFIVTISLFFATMCFVQIPLLSVLGLMTIQTGVLSVAALVPLLAGMPVGAWLAKQLNAQMFDRTILIVLLLLALKLFADAMLGI